MPIACIFIPRFAVEAERRRPSRTSDIAARLVLIGETTVYDCSLGAEASGVKRGMRMSEAIGHCPQAVVLPLDEPYYKRRFEEVLDLLDAFSPEVEPGPSTGSGQAASTGSGQALGTAYLSLDGLPALGNGEWEMRNAWAEELIAALHQKLGFMAAAGLANGKFTSRVAAGITRPGLAKIVSPGAERDFLAPLPVNYLAASEAMLWRLNLLGLTTMGDIANLPLGAFQAQFGPEGKRCWELAQGIDNEPLVPRIKETAIVRRLQLPGPAVALEAVLMGIERLVHSAYAGAGSHWVRKAIVRGALDGGGTWELPVAFREALANPREAWFAIKTAVIRRPPERPVEELAIELIGLSGESGKQASMLEGKGRLWRQIEEMVRQLRAQTGQAQVGKIVEVEPWSRIPERRAALADFDP